MFADFAPLTGSSPMPQSMAPGGSCSDDFHWVGASIRYSSYDCVVIVLQKGKYDSVVIVLDTGKYVSIYSVVDLGEG